MVNAAKDCGDFLSPPFQIAQALKEWAITIEALCSGELMLLLRKGGIRDPEQPFALLPEVAALFPTTEHQAASLLQRPNWMPRDASESSEFVSTDMIPLKAWVHITHRFAVQSPTALAALRPFHIWSEQFIVDRLKWRPHQPLQVLCVRAYHLPEPILLRRFPHHRGCRSWVNLDEPIIPVGSTPVLSSSDYECRLRSMADALQSDSLFDLKDYLVVLSGNSTNQT
jgi:hypothetical protein